MAARIKVGRRRSKYNAQPTTVDGVWFASKREAHAWCELRTLEGAGRIRKLERQVYFPLHAAGGTVIGSYVADFVFEKPFGPGWQRVVADAKGFKTDLYKWKCRHMKAEYGVDIWEI